MWGGGGGDQGRCNREVKFFVKIQRKKIVGGGGLKGWGEGGERLGVRGVGPGGGGVVWGEVERGGGGQVGGGGQGGCE